MKNITLSILIFVHMKILNFPRAQGCNRQLSITALIEGQKPALREGTTDESTLITIYCFFT